MKVTVYGAPWCAACRQAVTWLKSRGVEVAEKDYRKAPFEVLSLPAIEIAGEVLMGFDKTKLVKALRHHQN